MKIPVARAFFKKTTLFATAFVLVVSTMTAAVPFILSKTVGAAAPYNVTVSPKCENGLVSFDITGTNPDSGQSAVWVKSSAAFQLSKAVLAQPGATVPVPIQTQVASVPAGAVTIFVSPTEDGNYVWLNEPSAIASYGSFNCYSDVFVSPTGSDANQGTTAATPLKTLQKALDTVQAYGTVHLADGDYYGTANISKNGTKLIGTSNSRDTVKIFPTATSSQAGVFASQVNDITIKNLGVYGGAHFNVDGALLKINDGSNARIENVVVKDSPSSGGININTYSNVVVVNSFVSGVKKDAISVVAQQNTVTNVSKNITISNSSFNGGAGWSAVAFYTTATRKENGVVAATYQKSIEGVTLSNVSTQYGARGLYIEGAGGTVTSPSSNKLILQNFYAGDNTGEYINNEQAADIDASGARINIGNGVVVPVSEMTQSQYDATLLKIKDRDHKNTSNNNYGRVLLIDIAAPSLTLKSTSGTQYANGSYTNQKDVIAEWNKPVGSTRFTYKYWNDIAGNQYKEVTPYAVENLTDTSRQGSFTEGDGTHYIQIVAFDAANNQKVSEPFAVTYDSTNPTISGVVNGEIYRGSQAEVTVNDKNFDKVLVNGDQVTELSNSGDNYTFILQTEADGFYTVQAFDKAGNVSEVTFAVDNSVAVFVDTDTIDTTVSNPTITGLIQYNANNEPVANESIIIEIDGVKYNTTTDLNGVWSLTAQNLGNGPHSVSIAGVEVANFTTAIPVQTINQPVNQPANTALLPVSLSVEPLVNNPVIPTIINPTTFAEVLGESTDASTDGEAVKGTASENKSAAASLSTNNGSLLGLGWYWWLLILAAAALIAWWIIAAVRNRQSEN